MQTIHSLLSKCMSLRAYCSAIHGSAGRRELGGQDLEPQFRAIRHDFETPEHIDDSPVSAPSKRIQKLFPPYRKVQMGERVARAITLHRIRQECPLFNAWLTKLENLPRTPA